jgi:hypothetical protein
MSGNYPSEAESYSLPAEAATELNITTEDEKTEGSKQQ